MSLTVELPWPSKVLHPNARCHWAQRSKAAKSARTNAWVITMHEGGSGKLIRSNERIQVALTFCPPDRRKRDMDGMLSAMKSSLDGVAQALQVDDHLFNLSLSVAEPVKGGKVIVEISA